MLHFSIGRSIALVIVLLSLGTGLTAAQSADGQAKRLALKGYDPVSYFVLGKPTEGKENFEFVFDGYRYRFSSPGHMDSFKADPDKYAPQFGGTCTAGLSHGVKIEANPLLWRIIDGKLYVFSGETMPKEVESDPAEVVRKASKNWPTLRDKPIQ